jgi:CHAT domain-containing protein/tetratricopeptide (TPR) repeat protein
MSVGMCRWCVAAWLVTSACGAPPAADVDARMAEAREVAQREGPRAAVPRFQRILTDARRTGDRRVESLALGHLGTAYKNLGDYDRALDHHERALDLKRQLGDRAEQAKTLNNIGLVHWSRGRCDKALPVFEESLAIFESLSLGQFSASVVNNRGLCLDVLGRYRESREAYLRAIAQHQHYGNELGQSEALANLGGVDLILGRFASAAESYGRALALDERLESQQGMAVDLINLGAVSLGRGQPRQALEQFERAEGLAAKAGLAKEEADALRGKSRVLAVMGRYDDGRAALNRAMAIYERSSLATERVDALHAIGLLAIELGDLPAAARAFSEAARGAEAASYAAGVTANLLAWGHLDRRYGRLAEARSRLNAAAARAEAAGDHAGMAAAQTALSVLELSANRPNDADAHATRAVGAARDSGGSYDLAEALIAKGDSDLTRDQVTSALACFDEAARTLGDAEDPNLKWRVAFGHGRALERLGRLDEAVGRYLDAVAIIESVRGRLAASRSRSGFLEDKGHVYTALVSLLIRTGRIGQAFGVAERLRSSGFLDLVTRSMLLGRLHGNPDARDLLARIEQLQRTVAERGAPPTGDRGEDHVIRDELRGAERAWLEAVDTWARQSPEVAALRQRPPLAPTDLQRRLPPRTALIQYVVADAETVAFVMTSTGLRAQMLPTGREALAARVELLRALVAERSGDAWRAPALRLGADLIRPLEAKGWLAGVDRLIIVPHAELNYLPFAALSRDVGETRRLLIDDYALSLLPAASLLVAPRAPRGEQGGLLAMAPQPTRLPHSAREVESLSMLFNARPRVLVGEDATEHSFKREAGRHRVVHLATHGFFNRFNPLFSGLELGADASDDGRLEVFEILGLDLGASLVTLSACQTALSAGELSDAPVGEEFVGLTRAFLSAGAGTVMASLWDISDASTPALMQAFYTGARQSNLAQALAAAQRQRAASTAREAHPFYWAPFVLMGAGANRGGGSVN